MKEIELNIISKNDLATLLIEKDKEIERLNNIINEIIECIDSLYVPYEMEENWVFYGKEYDDREKVIEKIKELKGVDKE